MVLLVGSRSVPASPGVGAVRTVDGRPLLVGGGLSGERYPPGSAGQTSPDPGRTGGGLAVRGAAGCGHGYTAPGCVPPIAVIRMVAEGSVRVEGFLPVWGGFSSRTGLKPSPHQTQTPPNPTDQVMDDCVSPGRPAEREHVLSKSPLYRDRTHPQYHHPHPHISQKSRITPQTDRSPLAYQRRRHPVRGYPALRSVRWVLPAPSTGSPGHHNEAGTKASTDDRGVSVIVMACKSATPRPAAVEGLVMPVADRTCTTHPSDAMPAMPLLGRGPSAADGLGW